jgi:predicted ATP-grasp superfamily ATP-dependent carboligase
MIEYGRNQRRAPVLFCESDWALEFVARNRERLMTAFKFVLPPPRLLESLLDKGRFHVLAKDRGLPTPKSWVVDPASDIEPGLAKEMSFPVVVKALPHRVKNWRRLGVDGKVVRLDSAQELQALWPRMADCELNFLVQELIPGPESRIESYHVYADRDGRIAGEFTGRKIRTYPKNFGFSTALTTTADNDVAELGRAIVERLDIRGVAKLDFKRGDDGRLYLLEINPRFSLWSHVGALAGVNLPALVYADLVGETRPQNGRARSGVTWCSPLKDASAAKSNGMSLAGWLVWMLSCDANSAFALDDPMPFVRGRVLHSVAARAGRPRRRVGRS